MYAFYVCMCRTFTRFRSFDAIWYQTGSSRAAYETHTPLRCWWRCDAGTRERAETVNPETRATGPVRLSSFMGQRTPLSRHRGCHLLRHWPNHSEKPIESTIHFFFPWHQGPGGQTFLSASRVRRRFRHDSILL